MLNNRTECRCGGTKNPKQQFCHTCWNLLSPPTRNEFLMSVRSLGVSIIKCDDELREIISGESEGDQPCL